MAGRRAPRAGGRDKSGGRDPETYYVTSESDRRYAAEARQRVQKAGRRSWVVRLLALIVLGLLAWGLGPRLWDLVRSRAGATAQEFKQVGDNIRGSAERRAGSEFYEEGQ